MTESSELDWWGPRWKGQRGRLEVWYATASDRETGTGLWVHGETVAPTGSEGAESAVPAASHGWVAVFPPDREPAWARTGVEPADSESDQGGGDGGGFAIRGLRLDPKGTEGEADDIAWHLDWDATDQRGLATFPRWAWEREVLPAAQVVPAPSMEVSGWATVADRRYEIRGHGQAARIYGHGNAHRWGWLHADLGDGDVIELVTAVSRRPGLKALPPIAFLRLRVGELVWPNTRIASWGLRSRLDLPTWKVAGRTNGMEVSIEVHQPPQRCVSIEYTDPDGATATCTNTEQADLRLNLRTQRGVERTWQIDGVAHAEIGRRP